MKIQELLKQGNQTLEKTEEANLICKLLLAHFLGKEKQYLLVHAEEQVATKVEKQYEQAIEKIAKGIPLQYITHQQEFMKLNFYVDENVLIPRPDTEILVEEMLQLLSKEKQIKILDMCTGSGAIGISLAKYLPNAQVYLVDISKKALEVAQKNVKWNKVEKQIQLIHSNMFQKIPEIQFDSIVANPPYIETETILTLDKQVQNQPKLALDGGRDGLAYYRIFTQESDKFLKPEGMLGLEIGYHQKKAVMQLLEKSGKYKETKNKQDLAGKDRVIIAKRR